MPSADFCPAVSRPLGRLSRPETTRGRSPGVSSIAFSAQPPDLRFAPLMDMDFSFWDYRVLPNERLGTISDADQNVVRLGEVGPIHVAADINAIVKSDFAVKSGR